MKNKLYRLSLLFLLGLQTHTSYAMDNFDDLDELTNFANTLSDEEVRTIRSCEPDEKGVWVALFEAIDADKIFDEDFYLSTALPNHRNIINFPNFFIFSYQPPKQQQLTFHFFYNQTSKKNFVKDSEYECSLSKKHCYDGKKIGSYLNIENGTIASAIQNAIDIGIVPVKLKSLLEKVHFPKLFTTIANAHLEERRVGFLAHYHREINSTTFFEAKMPILWQIRNINFTEKEKQILIEELDPIASGPSGTGQAFDEVEFGKQHFVFDAFGTGTLDLTLKKNIWETENVSVEVGTSLYVPTDGHWTRGLYGTYFDPKDQQPVLNFCEIFNIDTQTLHPGGDQVAINYFLKALDHFSSMVLQCPLGYEQHVGFALKVLPTWQMRPNLKYSGVYIFEYLFPREQQRFFIKNPPKTLFSKEFRALDGNDEAQYNLILEKMTERLFPRVFYTKISPGFLFNTVSNLQTSYHDWDFTVGYNFWYKSKEKLSKIQAPANIVDNLNVCKATRDSASQIKIFGKIHKLIESPRKRTLSLSLYGDATVYSNNIGNDFTLGLSFDKTF